MKNPITFLLVFTLALSLVSCNNCDEAEKRASFFEKELAKRDSALDVFGESIKAIDSNLIQLGQLEMELATSLSESHRNEKDIESNVNRVREIMAMNKDYIAKMQVTADANQHLASNLMGIIEAMQDKVMQGNLRLARHNSELELLGDDFQGLFQDYIDSEVARLQLEQDLNAMEGNINEMENKMRELKNYLNTGYVAIGTKKELIDKGILEKGGLLQSKDINEDVDKMAFQAIDTRKTQEISLGTDRFKFVTEHPTSSYKIVGEGVKTKIEITHDQDFWSLSKYLVVIKN